MTFSLTGLDSLQAFLTAKQLEEGRSQFNAFKIPMVVIPSTISNNVPGTDFSLGCDTSLNEIVSVSISVDSSG